MSDVMVITGSAGLIGSEATEYFAEQGYTIVGIDNDMRASFFGREASTFWKRRELEINLGRKYVHHDVDIRDVDTVYKIFGRLGKSLVAVIHTAAQPAHDWAVKDPLTDFEINATGTMNMLEATRMFAPEATFIHTSTAKVYGDTPNRLPLVELPTRYEIDQLHPYYNGIDEWMSLDQSKHSLYGASKTAADVMAQEYGRYFDMNIGIFRGNCMTGARHSGTMLHGFLSYLMKCAMTGEEYTVLGYKGKQVRDNIHSSDFIRGFDEYLKAPRPGEVYNLGGGRYSNCSILEAIEIAEQITGKPMNWKLRDEARNGDHMWYISDISKFMAHYPNWTLSYTIQSMMVDIFEHNQERWLQESHP